MNGVGHIGYPGPKRETGAPVVLDEIDRATDGRLIDACTLRQMAAVSGTSWMRTTVILGSSFRRSCGITILRMTPRSLARRPFY